LTQHFFLLLTHQQLLTKTAAAAIHSTVYAIYYYVDEYSCAAVQEKTVHTTQDDEDQMYTQKCVNMGDEGEEEEERGLLYTSWLSAYAYREREGLRVVCYSQMAILRNIFFFFL
jgi:hypothetical protein